MCQAKELGGKRCFTHMKGTQAAISMAAAMSGLPKDFVAGVSKALRKEGKGLPMPSEEEIVAFAKNNQFISRHDVTIPDNMRKSLIRRWQDAEMERPDGGGFHAWKHTLVESVVRFKQNWHRSITAGALATGMLFASGCAVGETRNDTTPPASPDVTVSQSAEPSASPSATPTATEIAAFDGKDAPTSGKVVETPTGAYLQSTIESDDPAMIIESSQIQPEVLAAYGYEKTADGHQFAMKYVAEQFIDSPINGNFDDETEQKWWNENKSLFTESVQKNIKPMLASSGESSDTQGFVVLRDPWTPGMKYANSKDETRVFDRKINTKDAVILPDGAISYRVNVDFKMKAFDAGNNPMVRHTTGYVDVNIKPTDSNEAGWVFTGIDVKTNTK